MQTEGEQETELETSTSSQETPTATIEAQPQVPPSTPSTQQPSIKAELEALNRGALSSLHSQVEELKRQNELLRQQSVAPKAEPTASDFLSDPIPLIRQEMQRTVQPLVEFVGQVRRDQVYTQVKNQFRTQLPHLGSKITELEGIIDQLMTNVEPTPQNFQAAVVQAIGLEATGMVSKPEVINSNPTPATIPSPQQPLNQPRGVAAMPPNIPPTPPTLPPRRGNTNDPAMQLKAKVDSLTEEERNVARIWNMSLEQYVQYRDAPPDVAEWKDIK